MYRALISGSVLMFGRYPQNSYHIHRFRAYRVYRAW